MTRNDTERLECEECDWYIAGFDEIDLVEGGIYHAIGTGHTVSEQDLLERYDALQADT